MAATKNSPDSVLVDARHRLWVMHHCLGQREYAHFDLAGSQLRSWLGRRGSVQNIVLAKGLEAR